MKASFSSGIFGKRPVAASALVFGVLANLVPIAAADFPQAEISNGQIKAKMYLPDAKTATIAQLASTGPASSTALNIRDTTSTDPGTTESTLRLSIGFSRAPRSSLGLVVL